MKIKKIRAPHFGKLSNYESEEFSDSINVFYGKNEAGKSTIFNIITTLLYGFSPASRESNPYVCWDMDEAICEGEFVLDTSEPIKVARQLKSRVEGRVSDGSKAISINNNPLDFTGNISREMFLEVFAITQDKLGIPDESLWQKLQEQLLGGQYASVLRPLSAVIAEIDSEASSLWKDDNRGKPRDRELTKKIRELNAKLLNAKETEKRVYDIKDQLDKIEKEIETLKQKKYEYAVLLDKFERVLPVARKTKSIMQMKTEAGNIDEYNDIPENASEVLKKMASDIESLEKKLSEYDGQAVAAQKIIDGYVPLYSKVCKNKDRISTMIKTQGLVISSVEAVEHMKRETDNTLSELYTEGSRVLRGGYTEDMAEKLIKVDSIELKDSIDSCKTLEKKINEQQMKNEALKIKQKTSRKSAAIPVLSLAAVIAGIIFLIILKTAEWRLAAGGFSIVGFVSLLLYLFLNPGRSSDIEIKEGEKLLKGYIKQKDTATEKVKAALMGLPFADSRLDTPDETLLLDVRSISDKIVKLENIKRQLQNEENNLKKWRNDIDLLFKELDLEVSDSSVRCTSPIPAGSLLPDESVLPDIERLESLLNESLYETQKYENALIQKQMLEKETAAISEQLDGMRQNKLHIKELVKKLDGENEMLKMQSLYSRRRLKAKAEALEDELMDNADEYNFAIEQIEKDKEGLYNDDEFIRIKLEKEETGRQLEDKLQKFGSLCAAAAQLENECELDDIKSEIECCEQERKEICFKRDRLVLLRNILTDADRRFRQEHQPDVLLKAGMYLNTITGGKYDKIYSSDDSGTSLLIRNSISGEIVPVRHPLSRGTLEQIYLCLRIALMDHLDCLSEKLPLFMDETFINWDSKRMKEGIKVISQAAKNRQVVIFTCSDWLCELLLNETECKIIKVE